MKTSLIIKRCVQAALLGAALVSTAMAQPGPGWGGGPGMQRGMGGAGGGYGMGPGGGRGMGHGMGPGAWGGRGAAGNPNMVRGRALMTPEERTSQQVKMRAVKTYDECVAVQTEHRGAMEVRAKEKGVTLPQPRANGCDRMKARGWIN